MKKIVTFIVICGAVLTLFGLGTWQLQRLHWKQNIIENLEDEYLKESGEFVYNIETLNTLEGKENGILFGGVMGKFIPDASPIFLQPKTHDGKVGAHVIQPFELYRGGVVFVNRGWIKQEEIERFAPAASSSITKFDYVEGIFRKPEWNRFTSNNSPAQNIWTKADTIQLAAHYNIERAAPVLLYATKIENNQGLVLQDAKWYPRNKHLQYAIFWYGMIFVLLGLVGYAVKSNKKKTVS
jgi:surfeit locus 1 family protein